MRNKSFLHLAAIPSTLAIGLTASSCAIFSAPSAESLPAPDVIVIFVDDLGYADLSCQGSADIRTPNIDRIAAAGVRFTDGYVTAPQCSPSRAGIMTGRYNQRFGYEANAEQAYHETFGLPADQQTLGDVMQAIGYTTAVVGEWDLGRVPEARPLERGFDEFYGFYGASRPYLPGSDNWMHVLYDGEEIASVETDGSDYYLTDLLTDRALDFLTRTAPEPQFLYLAYHAPHWPLQAREEDMARNTHIDEPNRRAFAAIMTALDDNVGRILDHLENSGTADDTLLFFISDNGGPTGTVEEDGSLAFGQTTSKNDPLRGVKGQLYEGGIRIPYIVQWPSHIEGGQVVDTPVISTDVLPTIVSAGGGSLAPNFPTEGVDLLPLFDGENLEPRPLFFRWMGQKAVRDGDWKYVQMPGGEPELYRLSRDIGETMNLATTETERLQKLREAWVDWNADNHRPMWRTDNQLRMMKESYGNGMSPYVVR